MKFLFIGLFIFLAVFGFSWYLISQENGNFLRRGYDNLVLDNEIAYLDCEAMPTYSQIEKVMADHADLIDDLESVEGVVDIAIGDSTGRNCPGRGKIVITYSSHSAWKTVKSIIGETTIYGIPYDLVNI